jgi:YVTN family beta-propeller protein
MDFLILGPIEARVNGHPVSLGGPKQRAVLALLVLRANRVVSRDALIDQLWDGAPPPTAATALHGHVAGLRKLLGADVIATRSPGYVLEAEPSQVDLTRFEALRARARDRADPQAAARELRSALELWRGDALADIRDEPAVAAEAARLDDLRLSALEDRIDADLESGADAGGLVAELESLIASYPLRERLWGQLMLALYRAGRQADALDAYRRARHRLIAELGIEPSQSVRELHQRILEQDPALDAPRRPLRAPRRRRPAVAALAAVAVVAALVAVFVLSGSEDPPEVPPNSVAIVDAEEGAVAGAIALTGAPGPVAAGAGAVWVLNVKGAVLSRINPRARSLTRTTGVAGSPGVMTAAATELWIAEGCSDGTDPGVAHLFTTRDGDLVELTFDRVPLEASALAEEPEVLQPVVTAFQCGLAAAGDSAWVSVNDPAGVARVDYDHNRTASSLAWAVRLPRAPAALAVGAGALWAADSDRGVVRRMDPDSGRVLGTIRVGSGPVALAVGAGAVWVVNRQDESLSRIDPRTGSVTETISVGNLPLAVAVGAGSVWVANGGDGTLSRVDPRTHRVSETIELGHPPRGVAVAAGAVWVSVSS